MNRIKNNIVWSMEITYCDDDNGNSYNVHLFRSQKKALKALKNVYRKELQDLIRDYDLCGASDLYENRLRDTSFSLQYESTYIDGTVNPKKIKNDLNDANI